MGGLLSVDAARWLQPLCAPLRRPDRAHPGRHTPALRTRVCRVRPARSDSRVTMGPRLGGRASGACRPWRSGGSASGLCPSASIPGTPNRTGRTNNFTASSKPTPRGPPPPLADGPTTTLHPFLRRYNHERPHEALDQTVPAAHYQPSSRPLPRRLPPLEYPSHAEIRRVDQNGYVSWRRPLFVSVALADEAIAFEEVADGIWTVTFATVVLGRFDERQHRIHPIAATSVGRSASSAGSAPNRTNKERR